MSKLIPCDIEGCRLPVGEISDSTITITSRHHGQRHPTIISLAQLLELFGVEPDIILLTTREKDVIHSGSVVQRHL